MAKSKVQTVGDEQESLLRDAVAQLRQAPLDGARELPQLVGLNAPPKTVYTDLADNVILRVIDILAKSECVYAHEDDIVLEVAALNGDGQSLIPLRRGRTVEPMAECRFSNFFTCQDGDVRFPPPRWLANQIFASDLLNGQLPRILTYARRPVFDANYCLCSPGWHPDSGVLVHGPDLEPLVPGEVDPAASPLDRLPHHLKRLLSGFCFKSDADLANALAMFLTGLLANHYVRNPKGVFLIDGNQPGLGKTLLARAVGMVLDGIEPPLVGYTNNDEELEKRICALLRGRGQSMVVIDNAKVTRGSIISSPVVEANSVAPQISLRILGKSENITRTNDLLWVLTMNDTRVSPDLVSRGVPIRLAYEGRPEGRTFTGPSPTEYAREHRLEILGELAGMIVKWNQTGRPSGGHTHRSHVWAATVGGILTTAGFPEFLANADEAAATFNCQLDELSALAEAVVAGNGPFVETPPTEVAS